MNKLTMLSLTILRRSRPGVVFQSVGNIHLMAARRAAPFTVSCLRGEPGRERHAAKRSFLNTDNKVQSHSLSVCRLSMGAYSEMGNLIYTGNLGTAVRGVKMFSYSTSGISLILLPQILWRAGLESQNFALQATYCGIMAVLTFLIPISLHLFTRGYVIRLYHNPRRDIYTAITCSAFLTDKRNVFHQKQVKIPPVGKMFTSFYAGNLALLVNPETFPIPHDYNHLMGYDKPFSFDTDSIEGPDKS